MDDHLSKPRKVYVLGRVPGLDVHDVARRLVAEGTELVLISLGHTPSATQGRVVSDALRLADELRLWLDAVLVSSPQQVSDLIEDGDDVTILASGSERRRIERALGRRRRMVVSVPARPIPHRVSMGKHRSADEARSHAFSSKGQTVAVSVPSEGRPVESVLDPVGPDDRGVSNEDLIQPDAPSSESVEALAGRQVAQPALETVWTKEDALARKQATLRIYLGAAPGVGKTYAMLGEGQRRRSRGTDVVVGVVHTYDRPKTIEMLDGLEVIPPRRLEYRGTMFDEMDTDALIERRPEVALIDELAHTNIPGSRRAKRWEDVLDVLAQGISVITTLNIQHVASLNDVVAKATGIRQLETVPDWLLDVADQVELVDMSPQALQRRMVHGNVYPDPRKAEMALRRFFTTENLTALRELALMRVANQVDEQLLARWSKSEAPETRERILVCVSRQEVSDELIRRGCRIAHRMQGDLLVVHVVTGERAPDPEWVAHIRSLVEEMGGEFQVLESEDPVDGVLSFAYRNHVTQIIVGESLRSRWQELLRGSFVNRLIQRSSNVDVHVIARHER